MVINCLIIFYLMWPEYAQGCAYVCAMYNYVLREIYAQGPFISTDLPTVDLVFHVAMFC